eukprot:GHVU01012681.1.p4 GENE.GHVU01012681.1~~GHVU01012681.1.p4  ORF type:complete len:102 (+),score=10.82 GHVU01012681.1:644-949(+)
MPNPIPANPRSLVIVKGERLLTRNALEGANVEGSLKAARQGGRQTRSMGDSMGRLQDAAKAMESTTKKTLLPMLVSLMKNFGDSFDVTAAFHDLGLSTRYA